MRAGVLRKTPGPLPEVRVEDVEVDRPRGYEVLVRTAATGVCHSDLHYLKGDSVMAMPCVIGHEGAGVVEAVGEQVTYVQPGDHVICCLNTFCGACEYCLSGKPFRCANRASMNRPAAETPRVSWEGQALAQHGGLGTFAEHLVCPAEQAIPIRRDVPWEVAALIGCSVTTGVCAVTNAGGVRPGQSVVVIGCGGVGLNVVQGARLVSAEPIIAARSPRKSRGCRTLVVIICITSRLTSPRS